MGKGKDWGGGVKREVAVNIDLGTRKCLDLGNLFLVTQPRPLAVVVVVSGAVVVSTSASPDRGQHITKEKVNISATSQTTVESCVHLSACHDFVIVF